jgi:hypothetical protein
LRRKVRKAKVRTNLRGSVCERVVDETAWKEKVRGRKVDEAGTRIDEGGSGDSTG